MKKNPLYARKQAVSASDQEQGTPALLTSQPANEGLPRIFSSLRQRNFRLFWFGQIISLMGTWMQIVGQAWLVLELTHSSWQLGLVGALQALPILLFSIFGGVFADRWPTALFIKAEPCDKISVCEHILKTYGTVFCMRSTRDSHVQKLSRPLLCPDLRSNALSN